MLASGGDLEGLTAPVMVIGMVALERFFESVSDELRKIVGSIGTSKVAEERACGFQAQAAARFVVHLRMLRFAEMFRAHHGGAAQHAMPKRSERSEDDAAAPSSAAASSSQSYSEICVSITVSYTHLTLPTILLV